MCCIPFYGFNKVWNQIRATLELNFNLSPCLINSDIETDQFVVLSNQKENNECENS